MAERTYSQQEIARILDAAAKRQAASPVPEHGGLTLEELEGVAAASGIAPEHVAAAAAALGGVPAARERFLGMPVEVERSRLLPGAVSDETWSRMVAELRRAFGGPGVVSGDGRMRTWSTVPGRRAIPVVATLEPEGTHTRLTLAQSARAPVMRVSIPNALFAAFALVLAVVALTSGDTAIFTAVVFFGVLAALFQAGLQVGTRSWAKSRTRDFEAVSDRLELVARSSAGTPQTAAAPEAVAAPSAAPRPTLALGAEEEGTGEEGAASRRRARS